MNNFEQACLMSCEEWVNSFSDEYEFEFSKSFEKKMKHLIDKMRNNRYHKLTRRTVRALIIAAILLSFATTAFAIPSTREYIIKQFKDHFSYTVTDIDEIESIENISIGYLPEGFIKTDEDISKIGVYCEFSKDNYWFSILKHPIDTYVNYNNSEQEIIKINNIDYILINIDNTEAVVWNNGQYTYRIMGNIDKSTLIRIAEKTK